SSHAISTLAARHQLPEQRLRAAYEQTKQHWQETPPPAMPGARELLAAVSEHGGLNLVATHRDRDSATALLDSLGLRVDDMVCAPDGFARKPDPTMVRALLARHGLAAEGCVAVGDRPADVRAAAAADVRIDLPHTGTDSPARFERAHRTLAEDPRVAEHSALVTTRHLIETAGGEQLGLAVSSGDRSATPGAYIEGRAPAGEGEIALSLLSLSEAGVSVGEKLPIQVRGQWSTLEVVGSYQDLTNGGRTARGMLPADGEQVSGYVLGAVLTPGTEVAAVADDLSVQLPGARVVQTEATRSQLLGPLGERVRTAAALASSAAAALAALLAVMISRLWLATDAAALAVQRALGASPLTLRAPYLTRMLLSLLLGLGIGAALSLTAGQGLFNLLIEGMFGGMEHLFQGTSRIDLVIDPL